MQNNIKKAIEKQGKIKRFFMPGHKASARFEKYFSNFATLDVTELSFCDNLQNPQTILKKSQQNVADFFGFDCAFFLTSGATQGIFSIINFCKLKNLRLAILKNSHVSLFNACQVLNVDVVIFDTVCELYQNVQTFDAVFLTNLDYFGNFLQVDWQFFSKNKKYLFVDGAHSITEYQHQSFLFADAIVVSCHKMLPAFTQTAVLLVKNKNFYQDFLLAKNLISSTSPSYLLMASIEYAIMRLQKGGTQKIENYKQKCLSKFGEYILPTDALRIVFDTTSLGDGKALAKKLEKEGIFCEFVTKDRMVFLAGLDTPKADFEALNVSLTKILTDKQKATSGRKKAPILPSNGKLIAKENLQKSKPTSNTDLLEKSQFAMSFLSATTSDFELVDTANAVGRICAKNVGNYPPALPIICAGERIFESKLALLTEDAFGLIDNKICVVIEK